ncbi:MAG TPA: anti-sigma factor [Microbacterium sp.]|nr:anti-sigma factor [Microbacterium sp.]
MDDEFEELAAADAVGALGEDERLLLEAEASRDPRRAEQLLEARLAAAAFADSVSEVAPPPQIREQLLTRLDADPARPRARRRWFALAAVVAGLAVVGGGAYAAVSQLSRPAAVVALDQIEKAGDAASASAELSGGGEVTLHWSAELGRAVMTADELPDIEDDRDYEMWFVRDDGPVSAGVFSEEDDAIALIDAEMHAGDVFAVTVEQAGGSESGLPTTDPFVVIATS